MIAVDLLLLQMELEAIKPVSGELIARACEDVHDFPLVYSARTFDGQSLVWFDELIPAELRGRLSREELLAFETETAIDVLREADIYAEASQFRTYTFPEDVGLQCFVWRSVSAGMIPESWHLTLAGWPMTCTRSNARLRYCPRVLRRDKTPKLRRRGLSPTQTTAAKAWHGRL